MSRCLLFALTCIVMLGSTFAQASSASGTSVERAGSKQGVSNRDVPPQRAGAESSEDADSTILGALPHGLGLPRLSLNGFGDIGIQAKLSDPDGRGKSSSNEFTLGGMDLFITSELAKDFSFLSETLFEFEGSDSELDVERLLLHYDFRDWLEIKIGRGHTAFGYWNQRFHHGKWLQTTLDRPLIYSFDDHGGGLPLHFVGLEVRGGVETSCGILSYSAMVANGRGELSDDVQVVEDIDDTKAVSVRLRYEPTALRGFGFGVNGYFDKIPSISDEPDRSKSMREYIYGMHVFYTGELWEVLLEAQRIIHKDRVVGKSRRSAGAYAQVARSFGAWKPYYRFDWLTIADADPYYEGLGETFEDTRQHTVGIRWNVRSFVAIKLDYQYREADSEDASRVALEASFAF